MEKEITSSEIIADKIRKFWEEHGDEEVVVFFWQKYEWEKDWQFVVITAECYKRDNIYIVSFNTDFCEGQTCVKDIKIGLLYDVLNDYYKQILKK